MCSLPQLLSSGNKPTCLRSEFVLMWAPVLRGQLSLICSTRTTFNLLFKPAACDVIAWVRCEGRSRLFVERLCVRNNTVLAHLTQLTQTHTCCWPAAREPVACNRSGSETGVLVLCIGAGNGRSASQTSKVHASLPHRHVRLLHVKRHGVCPPQRAL